MKLSFEGRTIHDIIRQLEDMLAVINVKKAPVGETVLTQTVKPFPSDFVAALQREPDKPVAKLVEKPVDKPVEKKERTEKQKANDERLRAAALAKKAAGLKVGDRLPSSLKTAEVDAERPDPFVQEPELDPVEVVKIRQKTIEDLQAAYANGHQQEVMELLSRFGNGAKSFRELSPEAFMPIRQAIDKGALT